MNELVFAGKKAFDHRDDGWSWIWKDDKGNNCLSPMSDVDKAMLYEIIGLREKIDIYELFDAPTEKGEER